MLRWPALVIGVGLLCLSVVLQIKAPPLPLNPEKMAVQDLVEMTKQKGAHYVEFEGAPDLERKLYSTPCTHPVYTKKPTDVTYDLAWNEELLKEHLGTVVRFKGRLGNDIVSIQTQRKKGGKDEVTRERILVPVDGTDGKVWAISKVFKSGERPGGWLDKTPVEGVLTSFAELDSNVSYPELTYKYKALVKFIKKEFKTDVPADAFLILTDYEWSFSPHFYCTIKGSDDAIYVVLNKKTEAALTGTISGILKPWSKKVYDQLLEMMNAPQHDYIGFVELQTAEQYNAKTAGDIQGMRISGGFLSLFGGVLILIKRIRKKRRAKAA